MKLIFKLIEVLFFISIRVGIKVIGFASDGDPRLLSAMKQNVNLNFNALNLSEYSSIINELIYFQDPMHIGTKLRNLLLRLSVFLPFGNSVITVSHLKFLILKVAKDKHGLTHSDILPEDRQNYRSLEKMMEDRVIDALKMYIPGSEGTVVYLTICKYVTSSFLDPDLMPNERVYRLWYSLYLLRIWRRFIVSSDIYNLKENFLSPNCYSCIETNAVELLKLMITLRTVPEMFLPNMFDSQTCERTFRQLRSMGTINWTNINFGMHELLNMIERIELQNDIVHYKLADVAIFPRNPILNTIKGQVPEIPSNEDIIEMIKKAMNDAIKTAKQFELCSQQGVEPSDLNSKPSRKPKTVIDTPSVNETEPGTSGQASGTLQSADPYATSEDDEEYPGESVQEDSITSRDSINLRSYGDEELDESSKYIQICEIDGTIKNVLKSSLVWLLSKPTRKMSNDRTTRVQQTPKRTKNVAQTNESGGSAQQETAILAIGDCCLFSFDFTNESASESVKIIRKTKGKSRKKMSEKMSLKLPENVADNSFIPNILHGSILSFQNANQNTQALKQYHSDFVTIKDETNLNRTDIDVLAVWSVVGQNGALTPIGPKGSFYINLKNYIGKTDQPFLVEKTNQKCLKLEDIMIAIE